MNLVTESDLVALVDDSDCAIMKIPKRWRLDWLLCRLLENVTACAYLNFAVIELDADG